MRLRICNQASLSFTMQERYIETLTDREVTYSPGLSTVVSAYSDISASAGPAPF
jgi:hypothetical protein